jgi:hypothetical protein
VEDVAREDEAEDEGGQEARTQYMSLVRSSIRCSISGASEASMSDLLIAHRRAWADFRFGLGCFGLGCLGAWRIGVRHLAEQLLEVVFLLLDVVDGLFFTGSMMLAEFLRLLNSFFTSSRPTSFMALSRCPWNSRAMPRIFATVLPKARSTRGKSFGPMTMIATTAMRTFRCSRIRSQTCDARLSPPDRLSSWPFRLRLDDRLLLERLGFARGGCRFVVGHALLEALDALCHVTHEVGNLAAAEQQHDHQNYQRPVPEQTLHP